MPDSPISQDEELARDAGAAGLLIRNKERIVETFVARVRRSLRDARGETPPMIIDTLPAFLTQMARALASPDSADFASERSTIASQHGDERAKLTGYALSEVIQEYQILREILLDTFDNEPSITRADWRTLHRSIDEAMAEASTAFVQVHDEIRELFVASLGHDFRGPLGNASNYLSVLRRISDPAEREYLTSRAQANLRQIDRRITELLDVTRRRAGHHRPLDARPCEAVQLVSEVVDELRTNPAAIVELEARGPVETCWECERVQRAVQNLLENALKYRGSRNQPVTARVELAKDRVTISVHNFGNPIRREEMADLFQPFRRARLAEHSGVSGWGLGLAFVKAVAEAHGGTVTVESSQERGTIFTLDILRDARGYEPTPSDPRRVFE